MNSKNFLILSISIVLFFSCARHAERKKSGESNVAQNVIFIPKEVSRAKTPEPPSEKNNYFEAYYEFEGEIIAGVGFSGMLVLRSDENGLFGDFIEIFILGKVVSAEIREIELDGKNLHFEAYAELAPEPFNEKLKIDIKDHIPALIFVKGAFDDNFDNFKMNRDGFKFVFQIEDEKLKSIEGIIALLASFHAHFHHGTKPNLGGVTSRL